MMQTFTSREYLKIDIASNWGKDFDKMSWDDRITWFDTHQHALESIINTAEEPALFYAGVQAWRAVQRNEPIGYMVAFDATSSGLQILAALTGDRSAAELCNVVDTGVRQDAYNIIYGRMVEVVGEEARIDRKETKQAIMTGFYSSKAVPKQVFGEGELLEVFYDTLTTLCPGAWECNEAFLSLWQSDALEHSWVLPDNFHVKVKVMREITDVIHFQNTPHEVCYKINAPQKEGRSLGANTVHSIDGMIVREMTRRCDYDPAIIARAWDVVAGEPVGQNHPDDDKMVVALWEHYLASGYLSARILDHLNHAHTQYVDLDVISELLLSLPEKPFKLISVHDCFRCLPQYANDMRRQYNLQLQMIAKSELLGYLISQIVGRSVRIGKLDPDLWRDIADTNYALS